MHFVMDTCFWMHVLELYNTTKIDMRIPLINYKWGLTQEIINELRHFQTDSFVPLDQAYIFPIIESEFERFCNSYPMISHFDKADQSLILIAKREDALVLTDDGEIIMECNSLNLPVLRLPTFGILLVKDGTLDKTILFRALRFWEQQQFYSKSDLKKWKKSIHNL